MLLMTCMWASAQYWESGTMKTNTFYSYSSGNSTVSKTEVWYDINAESDGKMEFGSTALGAVRIDAITLYAVVDNELFFMGSGSDMLVVDNVAAGLYRVKINGGPTDRDGRGGNFVVSYVLNVAEYVNDPEPNDTWERAYQIRSGSLQHGHLGYKRGNYQDTKDWYKIEVPDEGTITFTTHTSTKLRLGSLHIYAPNEDGTDLLFRTSKDMDGHNQDTTIVFVVPDVAPGTYYIRLDHWLGYGSYEMKFPQCRALYMYMMVHPGKKLNFMGNEIAMIREWDETKEPDYFLLKYPLHDSFSQYIRDLNKVYAQQPALYERDYDPDGFRWIAINDMQNNVYGIRREGLSSAAAAFFNFSDQPHVYVYTPQKDEKLMPLIHTDWECYSGTVKKPKRRTGLKARGIGGVRIELPAFSAVLYEIKDGI